MRRKKYGERTRSFRCEGYERRFAPAKGARRFFDDHVVFVHGIAVVIAALLLGGLIAAIVALVVK